MKTSRFRSLLIIFIIAVVAIALAWQYTFKKTETNVSSMKPDFTMMATELLSDFENNEPEANKKYLNKVVMITGTVESVSEDSVGISVYMKEPDALAGIICGFNAEGNEVRGINKGMSVTVKGICTGYLMDVVLNKCSVVKENSR